MRKFKLLEEQSFYKEYEIEAESYEDAYQKWQDNTDEIINACENAEWEPSEQFDLCRIYDIENDDYWEL